MTDHVFGEDSYVECDWFSVVFTTSIENTETVCYCGADATQLSRVGFHTDTTDETPGEWPTSFSQNVKVHRCEDHGFEEPER